MQLFLNNKSLEMKLLCRKDVSILFLPRVWECSLWGAYDSKFCHLITTQNPYFTLGFTLGVIYSMGLGKCIMTCILHYDMYYSHCPKIYYALPIRHLPNPQFYFCLHGFVPNDFLKINFKWFEKHASTKQKTNHKSVNVNWEFNKKLKEKWFSTPTNSNSKVTRTG